MSLRISLHIDAFPSGKACSIGSIDRIVCSNINKKALGLRVEEREESGSLSFVGIGDEQLLALSE